MAPDLCACSGSPGDEAADLHGLPRSAASRALSVPPSRAHAGSEGQVWPAGGQPRWRDFPWPPLETRTA